MLAPTVGSWLLWACLRQVELPYDVGKPMGYGKAYVSWLVYSESRFFIFNTWSPVMLVLPNDICLLKCSFLLYGLIEEGYKGYLMV